MLSYIPGESLYQKPQLKCISVLKSNRMTLCYFCTTVEPYIPPYLYYIIICVCSFPKVIWTYGFTKAEGVNQRNTRRIQENWVITQVLRFATVGRTKTTSRHIKNTVDYLATSGWVASFFHIVVRSCGDYRSSNFEVPHDIQFHPCWLTLLFLLDDWLNKNTDLCSSLFADIGNVLTKATWSQYRVRAVFFSTNFSRAALAPSHTD